VHFTAVCTLLQGVKCTENLVTKSLDNIVGNLWQARQESSGSSMGNQVRPDLSAPNQ